MSAVLILSPEKHGLSGICFRRYALVRNRIAGLGRFIAFVPAPVIVGLPRGSHSSSLNGVGDSNLHFALANWTAISISSS
jgi:hypothetical protein